MTRMRRSIAIAGMVLAGALAVSGCGITGSGGSGSQLIFSEAGHGAIPAAGGTPMPSGVVARTRGAVTKTLGTTASAPWIDAFPFATDAAVIVLGGSRPSGGYGVTVDRVERDGDVLRVTGAIEKPAEGSFTFQALTEPYVALKVAVGEVDGVTKVEVALKD